MGGAARKSNGLTALLHSFKKTQAIDLKYLKRWDESNRRTDIASEPALSGRT